MRREISLSFTIAWDPAKPLVPAERAAVSEFLRRAEEVAGLRPVSLRGDLAAARRMLADPAMESGDPKASAPSWVLAGGYAQNVKARAIAAAMEQNGGNMTHAAKALGLSRQTVHTWMKKIRGEAKHEGL